MDKVIDLSNMGHANTCIKKLVFEKELDNNLYLYKPVTKWDNGEDAYLRINYDNDDVIEAIDFDGGPMLYAGLKIGNNYSIYSFVHNGNFDDIGIILKNEFHI